MKQQRSIETSSQPTSDMLHCFTAQIEKRKSKKLVEIQICYKLIKRRTSKTQSIFLTTSRHFPKQANKLSLMNPHKVDLPFERSITRINKSTKGKLRRNIFPFWSESLPIIVHLPTRESNASLSKFSHRKPGKTVFFFCFGAQIHRWLCPQMIQHEQLQFGSRKSSSWFTAELSLA